MGVGCRKNEWGYACQRDQAESFRFDGEECRETLKRWSDGDFGSIDGLMTVPSRWLESIQPCSN